MQCLRAELPRLYELKGCVADPKSPDAYFQNFDKNLANSAHIREIYLRTERVLQELDALAWEHLRKEAVPHLVNRGQGGARVAATVRYSQRGARLEITEVNRL